MRNNTVYYLSRLRLINYNGTTDETVDIQHGAHLLLVSPDRRSGVMMLDCICAALCGITREEEFADFLPDDSELHSVNAPRRKFFYFRPSLDVTPSYMALEITGDRGRKYTLALGTSGSRNRTISTWGAVIEAPVDKVDFWTSSHGEFAPRDARQLQDLLVGKGFYRRIDSYRRKVAEKFFGGVDNMQAFCRAVIAGRLWNTQTLRNGDFGVLLNRLLPGLPPHATGLAIPAYERMVMHHRRLDQLQLHCARLAAFNEVIVSVSRWRKDLALSEGAATTFRLEELEGREKDTRKKLDFTQAQLEECRNEISRQKQQLPGTVGAGAVLGDIRQLAVRLAQLLTETAVSVDASRPGRRGRKKQSGSAPMPAIPCKEIVKRILGCLEKLTAGGIKSDDYRRDFLAAHDDLIKLLRCPAWEEVQRGIAAEGIRLTGEKLQVERGLDELLEREEELQLEIIELEKCPEAQPDINYYSDVVSLLEKASIDFIPLYQGLEWRPETNIEFRSRLEEFCGHQILSTLVIAEEDYPRASEMVLREYPGIRIACARAADKTSAKFLKWVGKYFDTDNSDLHCLAILEKELSGSLPSFVDRDEHCWLESRAHASALFLWEPYLIGADSRRVAQSRKIDEREDELSGTVKEINRLKKEHKALTSRIKELQQTVDELGALRTELMESFLQHLAGAPRATVSPEALEQYIRAALEAPSPSKRRGKKQTPSVTDIEGNEEGRKDFDSLLQRMARETWLAQETVRLQEQMECCRRELRASRKSWKQLGGRLQSDFAISEPEEMVGGLCQCQGWESSADAERHCEHLRGRLFAARDMVERALAQSGDSLCRRGVYDEVNNVLTLDGKPLAEMEKELHAERDRARQELDRAAEDVVGLLIEGGVLMTIQEHQSMVRQIGRYVNSCLEHISAAGGVKLMLELQPEEERYRNLDSIVSKYVFYDHSSGQALKDWLIQEVGAEDHEAAIAHLNRLLDCRGWYRWRICTRNGGRGRARNADDPTLAAVIGLLAVFAFRCREGGIRLPVLPADILFEQTSVELIRMILEQACDLGLQLVSVVPERGNDDCGLPASVMFSVNERRILPVTITGDEDRRNAGVLPGFELHP